MVPIPSQVSSAGIDPDCRGGATGRRFSPAYAAYNGRETIAAHAQADLAHQRLKTCWYESAYARRRVYVAFIADYGPRGGADRYEAVLAVLARGENERDVAERMRHTLTWVANAVHLSHRYAHRPYQPSLAHTTLPATLPDATTNAGEAFSQAS